MSGDRPALDLDRVAAEIYSDVRLAPFLRRLLARSNDLLGAVAGSISLVDPPSQRYTKMAERGASCRLGQTFPLDEGVTGQVVDRRRPVVLSSYQQIPAGHLPAGHPAGNGAVVAVPIWWRGDVIGVNVSFAGRSRRFTAQEVDGLEMLTQLAAPGIVQAGAQRPVAGQHDQGIPTTGRRRRRRRERARIADDRHRSGPSPPGGTVGGGRGPGSGDVGRTGRRPARTDRPVARCGRAPARIVCGCWCTTHADSPGDGPILEPTQQRAAGERGWQELVDSAGGGVSVRARRGLGNAGARGPALRAGTATTNSWVGSRRSARGGSTQHADPTASPFTPREQQVAGLLADGLSDRSVAKALAISPKTVEKHVGALLRKTGTNSRTAAVMRALERGWLPSETQPWGISPIHPIEPGCT